MPYATRVWAEGIGRDGGGWDGESRDKADGKRGSDGRRVIRKTYNHKNPEPLNLLKPSGGGPTNRSIR
jgi:hypothetical protein